MTVSQRPFSVHTDCEINAKEISSELLREQNRAKNPALGAYLMLGVLLLASIGGMLILCYKCEHPASFQNIAGEVETRVQRCDSDATHSFDSLRKVWL
jgi:hypothetical protein